MSSYRLSSDSRAELRFRFNGQTLSGRQGDSLAAALLANDVALVGRSFKLHRPRGIMTAGCEEPNALVTLHDKSRREPNRPATTIELYEGLVAESQNYRLSLRFDLMALNQLAAPWLAAGFYYKTFMGPTRRSWMLFEPWIRRAAGLGSAPELADPDVYDHRNHFCDVLVIGAGAAGLAAANAAAKNGARTTLVEQNRQCGGFIRDDPNITFDDKPAADWIAASQNNLAQNGVTLINRLSVFGYYDSNTLGAIERVGDHQAPHDSPIPRQRLWTIRAKRIVIATGAIERPLLFANNDRPGIMLANAVTHYATQHQIACGRNIVIAANHDGAYQNLSALAKAGIGVDAIIDARPDPSPLCRAQADATSTRLYAGSQIWRALGRGRVKGVIITSTAGDGSRHRLKTDCVAMSGGWTPVVHLTSHHDSKPVFDAKLQSFRPNPESPEATWQAAGACNATLDTPNCLAEGSAAGSKAARELGFNNSTTALPQAAPPKIAEEPLYAHDPLFHPPLEASGKIFVDMQNDVTSSDIRSAQNEGYYAVEHLKRYTTLGMATDQGKTANVNALALMATTQTAISAETTRFRPPYTPIAIGALAGRHIGAHHHPHRTTPIDSWHQNHGANMIAVGSWRRPQAYKQNSETLRDAIIRESRAVRHRVGLCDVSTLGKINIAGPDVMILLDRLYCNNFRSLKIGRARYGLMLREDGMILDDGTAWRLADQQILITSTTAGALTVFNHIRYLINVLWPDLRVTATDVTAQWAAMSLAGPDCREVLSAALPDLATDNLSLAFMAVVETSYDGVPLWIARLSFSGERAYELFCPAGYGAALWEHLMSVGQAYHIEPYGTEALGALRIEKGHCAGGELDGRVSPHHLGLSAMLATNKPYIGAALANRTGLCDPQRYQLVGTAARSSTPLAPGMHLVNGSNADRPGASLGYISSAAYSVTSEREIGLALLKAGPNYIGETLYAANPIDNQHIEVDIVSPHFYDPDGARMKG